MSLLRLDAVRGGALRDVSFAVERGEIVGVVGPRNAGKSTLLHLCAGRRPAEAGRILIDGVAVRRARVRTLVTFAPDPPLIPRELAGVEWLRYLAAYRARRPAERERLVREALALAGAGREGERLVWALPGVALRRLALAGAALGGRPLLLLDEPLTGADPYEAETLRAAIAQLAAGGRGLLFATHDLGGLERLATRVIVLYSGRLVADVAMAALRRERTAEVALHGSGLREATWLCARFAGARRTGDGVAIPLTQGLSVEQVLAACRHQRIAVAGSRVRYRALDDLLQEAALQAR